MSLEERADFELREANSLPLDAQATASLPPADSGRAAWLFLLGSFLIETLLWGTFHIWTTRIFH